METRRAFLSGCMAFLSFPLQKAPPKHSLRSFPPCKTCRRRRTQPIPAESGDYLHFLNGFAKSLPFARTKLTSSQMSVSLKNKHSQLMEEFDEPPSRSTLALCLFHWRRACGVPKSG